MKLWFLNKYQKNISFKYITVCSAAITCVIVLTWFLFDQHQVINVIPHVIKVDPRCTSEVWNHVIPWNWARQFRLGTRRVAIGLHHDSFLQAGLNSTWTEKQLVSMIKKYHNHKLQTNPWHHKEEPHNNLVTPGRQTKQSNQLSIPHRETLKIFFSRDETHHAWIQKVLLEGGGGAVWGSNDLTFFFKFHEYANYVRKLTCIFQPVNEHW